MSTPPVPLLVFGDGPRLPTGLGRIARDLTMHLFGAEEELGIQVAQVGVDDPDGWHWPNWPVYGFQPSQEDYGRGAVQAALHDLCGPDAPRPIVLAVTDPARVYDLVRPATPAEYHDDDPQRPPRTSFRLWGYYPIDAHNPQGAVGGPAAVTVAETERLLGYGRYGAGVLQKTLQLRRPLAPRERVPYLPHGLHDHFQPTPPQASDVDFAHWRAQAAQTDDVVIGCVAANQPRKDFGLLFSTIAALRQRGIPAVLWLHTDLITGRAWDVGELAVQTGLPPSAVFVSAGSLTDPELAARYTDSALTIAPGLGEGFGYPIVESLACGTLVAAIDYAGGVELMLDATGLVAPSGWRLESVYALLRPVVKPDDFADVCSRLLQRRAQQPEAVRAMCQGAVAHLRWAHLWRRWRSWIRAGLKGSR